MNNVSKEKGEKFESIVEKIYIQIANNGEYYNHYIT